MAVEWGLRALTSKGSAAVVHLQEVEKSADVTVIRLAVESVHQNRAITSHRLRRIGRNGTVSWAGNDDSKLVAQAYY